MGIAPAGTNQKLKIVAMQFGQSDLIPIGNRMGCNVTLNRQRENDDSFVVANLSGEGADFEKFV